MKVSRIVELVVLIIFFLLLLMPFWAFLQGAIAGSLEMFPRPDDIAMERTIYIIVTGSIVLLECFIVYRIFRVVKQLRGK